MAVPIWKDYFVSLGSVATQYFRIRVNNNTIYQGKAVRAASSGTLYIRINDICADYMAQVVPEIVQQSHGSARFPISFKVQKSSNGSSWSDVETVDFNDDWSYISGFDPSVDGMSFPITGRIDLRQKIVQTRYTSTSVTATAYYGATTNSVTCNVITSTDFSAFWNAVSAAGQGRIEFSCPNNATYSGKTLTSVSMGGVTYTVTKKCPEYCLYYKNPFGGYDHLLLEGKCRKIRSGARQNFVANYDNRRGQREEWTFQNEITERYTLNTGFLSEDESSRMPYLLDSPDVYLVDLSNASVFIPVTIETDSYEVRKYSNADGMINYQFEVAVSQKEYKQ